MHQKYGHNQAKTIVKTRSLKNTQKPLISTQKPLTFDGYWSKVNKKLLIKYYFC